MIWRRGVSLWLVLLIALSLLVVGCGGKAPEPSNKAEVKPIKIGLLTLQTGALEAYGKQQEAGFRLGLEYATGGKMQVAGRPIVLVVKDDEGKPDVAKAKIEEMVTKDKVDIMAGGVSSASAVAVLPLLEEYKKVMVVEPAVADSITGAAWNKYVFRTGRNSSQDAEAGAAAIAKPGVKISILAQDYVFGRDGGAALKRAAEKRGAKIVQEQYVPMNATDFTPYIQKIISEKPDYLYIIWAGANSPWKAIMDLKLMEKGIKISTAAADIPALKAMKDMVGMEGFAIYYYELPKNAINDWLVVKHKEKYGTPPDLFTGGGFAAAVAIVEALKKTDGDTNSDKLIAAMEGMSFDSPKGKMTFRKEDHQALQTLYAIKLTKKEGYDYAVPALIRELSPDETAPPITNKR
ncbi:MAG: substrate-binding domain-containing protein [Firmicutes bacterium]|nr:substrate-binding domain-containing protein [Bacillota bacterium]MCL5039979.1 substrate-binding domain-containing protein [Bacillota bacterium]